MSGGYIEKGLMCRTTNYHSQFNRPMHANFGQNISQLAEITAGMDFSKERLAPIAATSLMMSPQAEGEARIINGWNTERCLFAYKIVHQSNHNGTIRLVQYLQGYTDYMGIHHGNNGIIGSGSQMPIDPRMRLFFNSSLMFQEQIFVDGHGHKQVTITPVEACQLLTGTPSSIHGNSTYTLRPEDVYSMMHTQEMTSSMNRYQMSADQTTSPVNIQDGRTMFQNGQPLKKSARTNLIPSNYLSKLFTAPQSALMAYANETNQDMANKISSSLSEGYLTNDATLAMLLDRTGLAENRSITYGELCGIFNNTDMTTARLGMESKTVQGAFGTDSEYMNGAGWELITAQMLQNVTSALLMETSMRKIVIAGDNYGIADIAAGTLGGQFRLTAPYGASFIDGRQTEYTCEQVKNRLIQEFLVGFTGHNYVPIGFSMSLDLYGECVITITYNNNPAVRFVTPMFGDSLYSPMLSDNRSSLAGLSAETRLVTQNLLNVL